MVNLQSDARNEFKGSTARRTPHACMKAGISNVPINKNNDQIIIKRKYLHADLEERKAGPELELHVKKQSHIIVAITLS